MMTFDKYQKLSEDELVDQVLVPLLRQMGYQGVFKYHGGAGEKGKDIVFSQSHPLGGRKNYAVVAKAVKLSGQAKVNTGTAAEIVMQVRQCFGSNYTNPTTGEQEKIRECWVISSKSISKEAIEAIQAAIGSEYSRHTLFVNGNELWELVSKHLLPVTSLIKEVSRRLQNADTHYTADYTISEGTTQVTLREKYEGASQEKPFTFNFTLHLPENEEGRAMRVALADLFEKGTSVEIPGKYVEKLEFPEFARALLGETELRNPEIHLRPVPRLHSVPVNLEFHCEGEEKQIINHVVLAFVRGGSKQITLANKGQDTFIAVELTLELEKKSGHMKFRVNWQNINAVQAHDALMVQKYMSKPVTIKMVGVETGIELFKIHQEKGIIEEPDTWLIDSIKDLAEIQRRIKRPILIPDDGFSREDVRTLELLRKILHEGKVEGKWTSLTVEITPTKESLENLYRHYVEEGQAVLRLIRDETIELFGSEIPLGDVEHVFMHTIVANKQEFIDRYSELLSEEAEFILQFKPGESNTLTKIYCDWK